MCDSETDSFHSVNSSDDGEIDSFYSLDSSGEIIVEPPSLAAKLESQFTDVPRNFNIVHINAQSIPEHFPAALATFDFKHIHAILVSESWLKPSHSTVSYTLPGFKLIRNDRTVRRAGGVAIYLRSHIPHSIISMSQQPPPPNAGEHLFLEVELNHTKLLLGVYYCPSSKINYFSSFETLLDNLIPSYSHTIIMGDFNTCLLKNDERSSTLNAIANSCNLSILPSKTTHHVPNRNPSLLDLIMVSSLERVAKHGQCEADEFSYHDLLFLSFKVRPPKAKPKICMQRNFRDMTLDSLRSDANDIDWTSLFTSATVDEQVGFFTTNLIQLYDKHAPIRAIKIKHPPSPWLTDEVKVLISKKAAAKFRYKIKPSETNWQRYVSARNHCNKVCRNAQRQHIHNSIQNGDPSRVWKFLKTLGVGKTRHDTIPKDLDTDILNQHFTASSNFDRTTKAHTINYLSTLPAPNHSPFVFNLFTACDVKKSIMAITSKAVGSDCISRSMILPILDEILPIICYILNHSITTGSFPSSWKDALITPLPKKSKPLLLTDYRPISILPFLSKVLERLVNNQLSAFISKNNLLNTYQSGFRSGHSTVTALVNITDDIRSGMESGKQTVLCLLDFSNAFNMVDFDILLHVLRSLNISPTVIDWFRSYLCGRRQRIRIEDDFSGWCNTSVGVPQGGVLSPLLFSIFINSISNELHSSYHLYADDLQIYTQAPRALLNEAIDRINNDLRHISSWSRSYGLNVNPAKTQVVVVGSSRTDIDLTHVPSVFFDGTMIPFSNQVKNLGIVIDSHLSWGPQLQEVSRKVFASAGSIRRLKHLLPITTKIALANSLLLPILDYADVSYLDLTENQLDKLERLQNLCIRFIYGLRKFDHVSQFRTQLQWLPIRLRRNLHILSLLYNILFNPSTPFYLKERFQFLSDSHEKCLRSSARLVLRMPRHSTGFFDNSFSVTAVRLWNELPVEMRRAQTLVKFKGMVKEHYLSNVSRVA